MRRHLFPPSSLTSPGTTLPQGIPRIAASEALRHRFMSQAKKPGTAAEKVATPAPASSSSPASAQKPGSTNKGAPAAVGGGSRGVQAAPIGAPASKAGAFSQAVGLWRGLTSKMFDLEAQILTQSSATQTQTMKVKRLKDQARNTILEAESIH